MYDDNVCVVLCVLCVLGCVGVGVGAGAGVVLCCVCVCVCVCVCACLCLQKTPEESRRQSRQFPENSLWRCADYL